MADVADSIELATLDKEMAEEQCETVTEEHEQRTEKAKELTVYLQIIKRKLLPQEAVRAL